MTCLIIFIVVYVPLFSLALIIYGLSFLYLGYFAYKRKLNTIGNPQEVIMMSRFSIVDVPSLFLLIYDTYNRDSRPRITFNSIYTNMHTQKSQLWGEKKETSCTTTDPANTTIHMCTYLNAHTYTLHECTNTKIDLYTKHVHKYTCKKM